MRLPPSCLFNARTACAVVPEPPKESRTMSSGSVANETISLSKPSGLEHKTFVLENLVGKPLSLLSLEFGPCHTVVGFLVAPSAYAFRKTFHFPPILRATRSWKSFAHFSLFQVQQPSYSSSQTGRILTAPLEDSTNTLPSSETNKGKNRFGRLCFPNPRY